MINLIDKTFDFWQEIILQSIYMLDTWKLIESLHEYFELVLGYIMAIQLIHVFF